MIFGLRKQEASPKETLELSVTAAALEIACVELARTTCKVLTETVRMPTLQASGSRSRKNTFFSNYFKVSSS